MLLDNGADIALVDKSGNTAMYVLISLLIGRLGTRHLAVFISHTVLFQALRL